MENQLPILTKQNTSYKIIIPAKVENMIRVLCSEVCDVEWSGVLFYTYTGSFETNDLEIHCEDICVMDIGSAGYTEYTESPTIINYQIEHDLLDCKTGLIHSHNHLKTFFSSTDLNTLKKEGSDMNNFVSLIVNNAGQYTAAITRYVAITDNIASSSSYKYFDQGEVNIEAEQYIDKRYEVQYFFLDIVKEEGFCNEILNSIQSIKNSKLPKTINNKHSISTPTKGPVVPSSTPTLFDTKWKYPFNEEEIQYDQIELNPAIVESAALQMVTGSILVTTRNKVTLDSWIKKMESIFDDRFPSISDYEYFIEGYIDSILASTYINSLTELDENTKEAILAYKILTLLHKYKETKYLTLIIKILNNYIL